MTGGQASGSHTAGNNPPLHPHLFFVMAFFISQDSAFTPRPDLEPRSLRLGEWSLTFPETPDPPQVSGGHLCCTCPVFMLALQNAVWKPQEGTDPELEETSGQHST